MGGCQPWARYGLLTGSVLPKAGGAGSVQDALSFLAVPQVHAALRQHVTAARTFTSTEVVYGVTGTDVTRLPEYGVSP